MEDKMYEVIKDIPLTGGSAIKKGTSIYNIHGVYYMDGGMLPEAYQADFEMLISNERVNGWNYIVPIKHREAFK